MRKFLLAALAACVLGQPAWADFDLQITEIWSGQGGSNDVTDDWFEVTNSGDMAWTAAADGGLWFDDDSATVYEFELDENDQILFENGEPVLDFKAVPIMGVTSIAPGESVIFVEGDVDAATEFEDAWGPVLAILPQVGYHDGSGLSGNGDAVTLFLDADGSGDLSAEVVDADMSGDLSSEDFGQVAAPDRILDFEEIPQVPLLSDGSSYEVALRTFSSVGAPAFSIDPTPGAVATAVLGGDDSDTPAVGSPGVAVPEPASLVLLCLGSLAVLAQRRQR